MPGSIAQRFRDGIRAFFRSEEFHEKIQGDFRSRKFVDEIEPGLARAFLLDYVEGIIRSEEHAAFREAQRSEVREDPQLRIVAPGFAELFTSLHQRLPIKTGRRTIDLMTASELRESAAAMRAHAKQRAAKRAAIYERRAAFLERIAASMSEYPRRLTFREFRALRAVEVSGVEAARHA